MTDPKKALQVEDLLRHATWVRRMAGELVASPDLADDLAQQTLLNALKGSAPKREAWRPWLRRIASNALRSLVSRESRRSARERLAVSREAPSDRELLERMELLRIVAEETLALPPPYRRTLLLHYFEDLSAVEIAARDATPPPTIRSQLRRGLELLRARLERRLGTSGDWRPALVPVFGLGKISGGLFMAHKLAIATGLIIGAFGGWYWLAEKDTPSNETANVATSDAPQAGDAAASAIAQRDVVAVPAPGTSGATYGAIEGHVTWEVDSGDAANVGVWIAREKRDAASRTPAVAITNEAGRFRVDDLAPGSVWLTLDRGGQPTKFEIVATQTLKVALVIPHGVDLRGRVIDEGGTAISNATIDLAPQSGSERCRVAATTGADGSFSLRALATDCAVRARKGGYQPSGFYSLRDVPIRPSRSGEFGVTLVLSDGGGSLSGFVFDPNGDAAAGATIRVEAGSRGFPGVDPLGIVTRSPGAVEATVVGDGSYRIDDAPSGLLAVKVLADGAAPWRDEVAMARAGEVRLDVRLARGASIVGEVRTEDGAPVAGAFVYARGTLLVETRSTWTESDGSFRIDHVPAGRIEVTATPAGDDGRRVDSAAGSLVCEDSTTNNWSPTLSLRRSIEGTALDAGGRPLAGWFVDAVPSDGIPGASVVRTDDGGRFRFPSCARGGFVLSLRRNQNDRSAVTRTNLVFPGDGDIVLRFVEPRAFLTGVLHRSDGSPPAEASVVTYGAVEARADAATGRFELGPLAAGSYPLWLKHNGGSDLQRLGEYELGEDQRLDIGTLVVGDLGRLVVDVSAADGGRIEWLHAVIQSVHRYENDWSGWYDGWGQIRSEELPPGDYLLWFQSGERYASTMLPFRVLEGVETRATIELRSGSRVEVRVESSANAPATREIFAMVSAADGALIDRWRWGNWSRPVDARGLRCYAPGEYSIEVRTDTALRGALRFTVPAKEPIVVSLR